MFEIMAKRCDQCLYSKDKIVSNARRINILKDLNRKDDYFICHKATLAGLKVACHGDWTQRGCGQAGRIAGRIEALMAGAAIKWVDEADLKTEEKSGPESNRVRKRWKGNR